MPAKQQLRILYIGDIMGRPGRDVVQQVLPALRRKKRIDLVIAQAENVSHGKGMSPAHMRELQHMGVDFFTGGNHTIERAALLPLLADPTQPVIAPLNQPGVGAGWGAKTIQTTAGPVLVASVLGTTFPQLQAPLHNPLQAIDKLLKDTAHQRFVARIVNFHGDWSSEKRVFGYYVDGRVSAVVGDHWHVPTADAMIFPKGTAHITDVGMCGTLHSSLGVSKEIIIERWRDGVANKNDIAEGRPYQFNAVLITVDIKNSHAVAIEQVQEIKN